MEKATQIGALTHGEAWSASGRDAVGHVCGIQEANGTAAAARTESYAASADTGCRRIRPDRVMYWVLALVGIRRGRREATAEAPRRTFNDPIGKFREKS